MLIILDMCSIFQDNIRLIGEITNMRIQDPLTLDYMAVQSVELHRLL